MAPKVMDKLGWDRNTFQSVGGRRHLSEGGLSVRTPDLSCSFENITLRGFLISDFFERLRFFEQV